VTEDNDTTRVIDAAGAGDPFARLVGSTIAGRYRIERQLGAGAMGAVYLGRHLRIGRLDAIKVLHPRMAADPESIARFNRGARNIAAVRHPNVCTIYDFGDTEEGLQYLAMEFVAGTTLKNLLDREGRLPVPRALAIIEQVATALQAAHGAGVVHRDLKPANIMVTPGPGGSDVVKVVDFDISKAADDQVEAEVTRLGYVVGTPEYMSPEQIWGGSLDGRSDVYSMALVLYRMLSGGLPFRGGSVQETMAARLTDTPLRRLDQIAAGASFPAALQTMLERALRQKPAERTTGAAEFAAQIRRVRAELDALPTAVLPSSDQQTAGSLTEGSAAVAYAAVPATRVAEASDAQLARPGGSAHTHRSSVASDPQRMRHRRLAAAAAAALLLAASGFAASQTGLLARAGTVGADGAFADGVGDPGGQGGAGAARDAPAPDAPATDAGATAPPERDRSGGSEAATAARPQSPQTDRPTSPAADAAAGNGRRAANAPGDDSALAASAVSVLRAQRDRLAVAPAPDAAALRAMRDTAAQFFDMPSLPHAERGLAAHVAASASFQLGEHARCVTWAGHAVRLVPGSAAYSMILSACRDAGPR
jgi:eukaryotic-like serine/threonine-protein kinase